MFTNITLDAVAVASYVMLESSKVCSFLLIDDMKRFREEMLQKIDSDETFLDSVCFSDKAAFHLDDIVNMCNCRTWGSQPPQEIIEHQRGLCYWLMCGVA
jgi:hypothetical protein